MKIHIELDTKVDDPCLINKFLQLVREEHVDSPPAPVVETPKKEAPKKGKRTKKEKPANPTCTCKVCGNTFVAKTRRPVDYCSPKCRYKLANAKRRHGGAVLTPASQVSPLQVVKNPVPLSKPIVQPAAPVAAHPEKKCRLCELNFIPDDPNQKFCNRCLSSFGEEECIGLLKDKIAKEMAEKEKINSKWRTCPKCAKDFEAQHDEMFCPKCTEILTKKKRKKRK